MQFVALTRVMAGGAATRKSQIVNSVDAIQAAVERMPQVELPLTHPFTPGMYNRGGANTTGRRGVEFA